MWRVGMSERGRSRATKPLAQYYLDWEKLAAELDSPEPPAPPPQDPDHRPPRNAEEFWALKNRNTAVAPGFREERMRRLNAAKTRENS